MIKQYYELTAKEKRDYTPFVESRAYTLPQPKQMLYSVFGWNRKQESQYNYKRSLENKINGE